MKFEIFSYYNKQMMCYTSNLLLNEVNSTYQLTGIKRAFAAKLSSNDYYDFVGIKLVKIGTFDDETGIVEKLDPLETLIDFDYSIQMFQKGKAQEQLAGVSKNE